MRTAPVVGLGLCVVDHTYRVDRFQLREPRIRYTESAVTSGGMMGTALCQAARLGCPAHVLSVVGDDAGGRFVRRCLRDAGVKTRRLRVSPRVPTTVAVVLVDRRSGERRFIVPDRRSIEARAPALDLSVIDGRSLLLLDGHFPDQALKAAQRARRLGARVIGDFHRDSPAIRRLLPLVDHPIVSREFVQAVGDEDPRDTLRSLAAVCRGRPVVTLGARGGLYLDGARVRRFPAPRVRVVDSTGAGDAFHGAFAAGLAHGLDFAASLALAARAGALACTALGGSARLMSAAEMRRGRPPAAARASGRAPRGR